ncbi:WhiB family transcriptional regulator [Williamsia sp. MIQD14]|uniref:WhiB family transcriptional regulator n=1 Tax=Williamsia sp. MIQD14 TaxID=3425703 RepID=UPI003DA0F6EA
MSDYPTGDLAVARAAIATESRLPCRVADPDLWFAESPSDLEQAKALCSDCPLRRECLDSALDRGEPWGVWGGEIFSEGVVIARKRPRGRPRKHPVAA